MRRSGDFTLREIARVLGRYQPFFITVAVVVLVATFLPGEVEEEAVEQGPVAGAGPVETDSPAVGETPAQAPEGEQTGLAPEESQVDAGADVPGGPVAASEGETGTPEQASTLSPAEQWAETDPMDAPDCDPETGRIKVPSNYVFYPPNCVPLWPDDADNWGETYQGVTEDTITVTHYIPEGDPQQGVMMATAGLDTSSEEERREGRENVIEAYESHLETYGRRVEVVEVQASSGDPNDDAAHRSDAIRIAEEIGAFANISSPTFVGAGNAFNDELAARGVLCIQCVPTQPHWNFQEWAPYGWNDRITGSGALVHNAEYIGKRLGGGPPEYSPDPEFALTEERKFGLFLYNTEDGAYDGMDRFLQDQLAPYGIEIAAVAEFQLDFARAQERARTMIARFRDQGITSVICWCDPFLPVFFTNEATNQQYFPEWLVTGSIGTDTALFGRTYDQQQWRNAFGVSVFPARLDPDAEDEEQDIVAWHHGEEPDEVEAQTGLGMLYTGLHLAGPNLNPDRFRDGMMSLAPAHGYITRQGISYGEGVWPWPDYNAMDDATLIWWDAEATGPDEADAYGTGLYRYVEMGERHLPGQWPDTPAPFFEEENTVTIYDERPEGDRLPTYERREPLRRP